MVNCSAPYCRSASNNIRLFRYPRNQNRREKWVQNSRRENWQPKEYSKLCELHFEVTQFELKRVDGRKLLKWNAVPTIFNVPNPHILFTSSRKREKKREFPDQGDCTVEPMSNKEFVTENLAQKYEIGKLSSQNFKLKSEKLKATAIKHPRKNKVIQESLSSEGILSSNEPAERVNHSIHADHSYCLHSPKTSQKRKKKLREQIKQGVPLKKMRRKKLKPTLHNIYKSQKYQPIVILHRLPKSVVDYYINTVYEPCFVEYELETSAGTYFNSCETSSKTVDTEEERITVNKSSQLPLEHEMSFTVKETKIPDDKKSGRTVIKNRILASCLKENRSSLFVSPSRSQKSVKIKSHLTSVKKSIFPGTSKTSKLKSTTPSRKYTNKSAASPKNKQRNKTPATRKTSKAAKIVEASNGAHSATTLHKARCPATLKLGPAMLKELQEILSTVNDAVIAVDRLLSTVEKILLGVVPLTSSETSDHLEMGEICSELVHAIEKENTGLNMCNTNHKTLLGEERLDRDTSIDDPSEESSAATAFETDCLHNNSEHSHSEGELSLPPSPMQWLSPKIVSVRSMAAQSTGNSNDRISHSAAEAHSVLKQILSSKIFNRRKPN